MAKKEEPKTPARARGNVQKQANFHLDPGLLSNFRIRCIRKKVSMRAVVEGLIEGYLKGEFELEEQKTGPERDER